MADAGERKVKILILVPLTTTVLSMLMWLCISILGGRGPAGLSSIMFFLAGFSMTIGLVMAVFGTVAAMMENMNLYKVIGIVLVAFLLFIDIWLYMVIFRGHKPPEQRPTVTTTHVETTTSDS